MRGVKGMWRWNWTEAALIRNFLAGAVWGGVVASVGLAVVSEVAPLPERSVNVVATEVAPPAVTAADSEGVTTAAPLASGGETNETAALEPLGVPETSSAPLNAPETDAPAAMASPDISADTPAVAMLDPAPAADSSISGAATVSPDASGSDTAPVQSALPPVLAPETQETLLQPAQVAPAAIEPAPSGVADVPTTPEVVTEGAPKIEGRAALPQIASDAAPAITPEVTPRVLPQILPPQQPDAMLPAVEPSVEPSPVLIEPVPEGAAEVGKPKILDLTKPSRLVPDPNLPTVGAESRLPSIGEDATKAVEPDASASADSTPLHRYARTFLDVADKPRYAIVLIDDGSKELDRAKLAALPFPVTFAVDPMAENAQAAAQIYRAAGQEVITLANGIPPNASASDLEQSFQSIDAVLPESVAVLDLAQNGFQDNRPLATQVVAVIKGEGRGVLTYDRGLNAADQVARRDGVPAATIFRSIDDQGEDAPLIRRYLDRAAFKAAQEGHVVVIGQTRPETITALLEWTVEGRASSVALAPISAVLGSKP